MRKTSVFLLMVMMCGAAFAAPIDECKVLLTKRLTDVLEQNVSSLNLASSTVADDAAKIMQPVFNSVISSEAACVNAKNELAQYGSATFSVEVPPKYVFDIEMQFASTTPVSGRVDKPEEIESLLPWYGILVVKKGSLDSYANSSTPIISSEYMKKNKDRFFPANSDKLLGMTRGCTHGNHMAHDKDVVNRAAHITMDEKDSFWTGNDYYVYDGEDVYWGTAQLVGEVAAAVLTLGASSAVSASRAAAGTAVATDRAIKAQRAITLAKRAQKLKEIENAATGAGDAARAARAANLGREARQAARLALEEAGAGPVGALTNTDALVNMGSLLEASGVAAETTAAARPLTWVSALAKPWRLVRPGLNTLKPTNVARLYGPGVSWGQRIKRAALTAGGVALGTELIKAFGYSSANVKDYADGVGFNSFGLLSADDLDGRENVVSHGAWIEFSETGEVSPDDTLNEALAFAEAFQKDMDSVNKSDPLCDVDIYVVQPGISNPAKLGTKEIYYIIQNPGGSLRVSTK